jgi:hypothetical protein
MGFVGCATLETAVGGLKGDSENSRSGGAKVNCLHSTGLCPAGIFRNPARRSAQARLPAVTALPLPCANPPADRRLRRRRLACAAPAGAALARAGPEFIGPSDCRRCALPAPCRCWATSTTRHAAAAWAPGRCHVLHLAPPPARAVTDPRTRHLVQALARGRPRARTGVRSTTGCLWRLRRRALRRDACRGPRHRPRTAPCRCRGHAALVRAAAGVHGEILRVPGIYASDRAGGHPRERLQRGTPAAAAEDDVHQPHPRRRPGARLRGCTAARCAAARAARQRRHRAAHGRLL